MLNRLKLIFTPFFIFIFCNIYSQGSNASTLALTAPANPKIKNLIFSLGSTNNPLDISSSVLSTPVGTIPAWCDVNGNNCNTYAPILPTSTGRYVWCIKSYDTTSGIFSTNCAYDTVTMLPSIATKKLTLINTVSTNPKNIASTIESISNGCIPKWCDINGNNCSYTPPGIPNVVGTYVWTVFGVDTINNLTSIGTIKDTLVLLDPNKIFELNKRVETVKLNTDGTFTIQFNFIVTNNTGQILNTLVINDDLTKVFNASIDYKVVSIENSGYLNKNPKYDGVNEINIVGNKIILLNNKQDSIFVKVLVKGINVNGTYTNSANATITTSMGMFNATSNDPIVNPTDLSNKIPTQFIIPKIEVIIPGGFSPNNDGIDDTWMIKRPYGTKISVKVFNVWGNEVYKNYEYLNDWRGKGITNSPGQDIPTGTYFYIVEATDINGVLTKFNGALTIVR